VWFCHRGDGLLAAILYEVNNTFGERHSYLIPVQERQARAGEVRQACDKAFFVSPFMPMELGYAFRVAPPGDGVSVAIAVSDAEGLMLNTAFAGERVASLSGSVGQSTEVKQQRKAAADASTFVAAQGVQLTNGILGVEGAVAGTSVDVRV